MAASAFVEIAAIFRSIFGIVGTTATTTSLVVLLCRNPLNSVRFRLRYQEAMTDPAVKIASAFCVILAGLCASTLFRHNAPAPAPPPSAPAPAAISNAANHPQKTTPDTASKEDKLQERVFQPIRPAPELANLNQRLSDSMDAMQSEERVAALNLNYRIHKVVDGDTLESLAKHYLGFSARAAEIFEVNRGVLSDPELLPIGAELKIPLRNVPATAAQSPQSSRL